MRFKPRSNRKQLAAGGEQTLVSDRESLPFPEGGVFSAKTSPTRPSATQSRPERVTTSDELDQIFDDIKSGLDDLDDLLEQPFRLHAPDGSDDGGPRRAA